MLRARLLPMHCCLQLIPELVRAVGCQVCSRLTQLLWVVDVDFQPCERVFACARQRPIMCVSVVLSATCIASRAAGLLHYQQNRDCARTAKYTISYNSDDPQTVNQAIVSIQDSVVHPRVTAAGGQPQVLTLPSLLPSPCSV
jgi:hypothetical protein